MTPAEFMKNQQIAWSATSRDQCDGMQSPFNEECFMTIAARENDIGLCERVSIAPYEGIPAELSPTRDRCFFKVAEHSGKAELCAMIHDPTAVAKCLNILLPLATINGSLKITPLDKRTQYSVFCEKIQPQDDYEITLKANCFSNAAIYAMNPSLCEKSIVPNSSLFDGSSCFHGIATTLNNVALCERIQSTSLQQACKNTVAIRLSKGIGPKPVGNDATLSSAASSPISLLQEIPFSSENFTLSFVLPSGFDVRDRPNSIRIARTPFVDREIGDDNAFFGITRYNQYNTMESELARYRKLLLDLKESANVIDGTSFITLSGKDWGRFEGDSAGNVLVILFPKSWLEIIERPANASQSFEPLTVGKKILSTMRFSK